MCRALILWLRTWDCWAEFDAAKCKDWLRLAKNAKLRASHDSQIKAARLVQEAAGGILDENVASRLRLWLAIANKLF